jgi:uridine kinase
LSDTSNRIAQHVNAGSLVLVGGLARQGKSLLAAVLCHVLRGTRLDARVLALDGFLRNLNEREPGILGRYDLASVLAALTPWLRYGSGIDIEAQVYDRLTRRRTGQGTTLHLAADSVLIVEGVPALLMECTTHRRIVRVYVTGDEASREQRVIDDLIVRGMSLEEARLTSAGRAQDETPIVAASVAHADIVVSLDAVLGRLAA